MDWNSPVSALKGIGEQRERKLQKLCQTQFSRAYLQPYARPC